LTEKESGLKGKLLRPLSAKLLRETDAEKSGLVNREMLEGISGRGRHRQIELAKQFGLDDYPNPASGCLLTDEGYSNRLRDLLSHSERLTFDDLNLLRLGRHFRLDPQTKVIVGRNEIENNQLIAYKKPQYRHIEALGIGSPVTLVIGDTSDENLQKASMITARYSSAKYQSEVELTVMDLDNQPKIVVAPASDEDLKFIAVR
jgi:hypothetical protein